MFTPNRDQARRFFFDVWARRSLGQSLQPLERLVLGILLEHPEYHTILDDPDRHLERDWLPTGGETNPFLHLSLHLAIEEQLSIDQPPGIRAGCRTLEHALGDAHAARHVILECLAETIWQAQHHGTAYDGEAYLRRIEARAGQGPK